MCLRFWVDLPYLVLKGGRRVTLDSSIPRCIGPGHAVGGGGQGPQEGRRAWDPRKEGGPGTPGRKGAWALGVRTERFSACCGGTKELTRV